MDNISVQAPAILKPRLIKSANPVFTLQTFAPMPKDTLDSMARPWWDISWDKNDPPDWIYPDDPEFDPNGPIFRHEVEGA